MNLNLYFITFVISILLTSIECTGQKNMKYSFRIKQKLELIDFKINSNYQYYNKITKKEARRCNHPSTKSIISRLKKPKDRAISLIKYINSFQDSLGYSVENSNTIENSKPPYIFIVKKADSIVSTIEFLKLIHNYNKDNILLHGYDTTLNKSLLFGFGKKLEVDINGSYSFENKVIYSIKKDFEEYKDSIVTNVDIIKVNSYFKDTIYNFSYTLKSLSYYREIGMSIPDFSGQGRMDQFYIYKNNFVYQVEQLYPQRNLVFLNGINLNEKYGYDKIINYCYINDNPTFLFTEENHYKLMLSYNRENLKTIKYDEIYWWYSPYFCFKKRHMIFHARKKNRYYKVEIN